MSTIERDPRQYLSTHSFRIHSEAEVANGWVQSEVDEDTLRLPFDCALLLCDSTHSQHFISHALPLKYFEHRQRCTLPLKGVLDIFEELDPAAIEHKHLPYHLFTEQCHKLFSGAMTTPDA